MSLVFGVTYFYSLDGTLNLKWMCIGQLLEHLGLLKKRKESHVLVCCSIIEIFSLVPAPVRVTPSDSGPAVGRTAVPHRRERLLRDCDDFPQSFPHRSSVRSVRWRRNARAENYRLWPNELSLPGPMWARRGEKVTEPFLLQLNVINLCLSNEMGGEPYFQGFLPALLYSGS